MATEEAAKPSPLPPYPEMILEAIKGLGDDKNGSNKSTISMYIERKYGQLLPSAHALLLTAHLAAMTDTGELIFLRNNYFRADAPGAPPKRGRGRPPKANNPLEAAVKQATPVKRKRGRPPKAKNPLEAAVKQATPVKRRGRPPKKKPELAEIFYSVAVDGSSSHIPGQVQFVEDADGNEEGEDADADGFDNNSMSTSSRKRESSTTDTTASPAKKSMAALLNQMHGLIQDLKDANHQFRSDKAIKEKQEKEEVDKQTDRCLRMAVECGATEESEEYFMATTLFEKEYNRKIFCKFSTAEARFMWLKRWCQRSRG